MASKKNSFDLSNAFEENSFDKTCPCEYCANVRYLAFRAAKQAGYIPVMVRYVNSEPNPTVQKKMDAGLAFWRHHLKAIILHV